MKIQEFFDKRTYTLTYVVYDPNSKDAVIIDPVLDYDKDSKTISFESLSILRDFVGQNNLDVRMILETHVHADHLSSSQYLKELYPGAVLGIGENIRTVQQTFKEVLNKEDSFPTDGSQFDRLFKDGEKVVAGSLEFEVLSTPGHTPACVSFYFAGAVFTGDALFMPDSGTGRTDFPAGSAEVLYQSVKKIYDLPDTTKVFVGHDYQPQGRNLEFVSTVSDQKGNNIHLKASTSEKDFIAMREARDKTLKEPALLGPSISANIEGGDQPESKDLEPYSHSS